MKKSAKLAKFAREARRDARLRGYGGEERDEKYFSTREQDSRIPLKGNRPDPPARTSQPGFSSRFAKQVVHGFVHFVRFHVSQLALPDL
jgi:hypothetical protein